MPTEFEWGKLLLSEIGKLREEIADLRNEFQEFKEKVIAQEAERKGKQTLIAAFVSVVVSAIVAWVIKKF